jgi:hypothetical protein
MLNTPFPTTARFLRWKLIRCEQKDAVNDGSVQLKTYLFFLLPGIWKCEGEQN